MDRYYKQSWRLKTGCAHVGDEERGGANEPIGEKETSGIGGSGGESEICGMGQEEWERNEWWWVRGARVREK